MKSEERGEAFAFFVSFYVKEFVQYLTCRKEDLEEVTIVLHSSLIKLKGGYLHFLCSLCPKSS